MTPGAWPSVASQTSNTAAPKTTGARRRLYRKLIAAAHATRAALQRAADRLTSTAAAHWRAQVDYYLPLIACVLEQSERRVLHGQAVRASEKLVGTSTSSSR